jgi:RHS repeat-associated protein
VFLPDGSQIDVSLDFAADVATEWDPFVLRDPNGNEVEIYKGCDEYCENLYVSIRDQYWEEESDREIRINFVETENEPTDYEIFAPGSGGAVEWTVDFEYVTTPAGDKEFECSSGEYCGVGSYTRASVEHISVPSSPATTYTFEYNNGEAGWGEIISMTVPSGAEYTYDYEDLETRPQGELTRNRVESRTVGHDSESDTWTYEYDSEESTTKTTAPDGGETVHHIDSQNRVWKVDRPNGSATERVFDTNPVPGITNFTTDPNNSFVEKLLVTIGDDAGDPTLTTITEFEYDRNGNPTSRVEYDWVAYPGTTGTTELRTTTFDYVFPHPAMGPTTDIATGYWREHHSTYWSGDLDPRRMNAVQRVTVSEDGTTPLAVTEFEYDDAYGTGNVTAEEHWDSEKAGTVPSLGNLSSASARVIMRTYNSLGQVTEVDGGTVNTEITYGTIPTGSGPGPYPTLVEYAPGTGIARTFSFDWDYGTGFLDAETDDDNSIETAYTYDALGRTLTVDEDGVRQTETVYDDEDRLVITKSDLAAYQDGKLQSAVHYDQLGRVIRTRVTDGSALSTSPSATDGINVQTIYTTVSGGNRVVTSTPYRTTSDPTLEWGCTTYDLSGRVILSSAFTGSTAPTDCASTSSRTAHAEIVYDGNRIETTDPAAKKREEYRDALGRIVQVVEDPGGTLDYETDYAYDPVGNLLTVDQGVQTRTFEYSSLSLLLSADNAESGETGYTYQPDGSLATVTDARGIVSSYTYDALGRITAKSYGDGTPAVGYSYFTSGAPNIGQLHRVSSSTAVETFNGYDVLGRVTSHTQSIFPGSTAYTMAYTYWLDDSIATMTYPSGREVAYSVDDAGRPRIVSDGTTTYADLSNATSDYAPDGRPARMELGNELWETREFRPAGTTTTLKLGTTSGGSEKLKLEYDYQPEGMGLESNGNLTSHVITHPGSAWTQSFTYDEINRLASATETSGFSRDYGYDQYGNRWIASSTGPYHSDTHEPTSSTNFSTATNRLTVASSTYDDAGNQTYFAPYTLAFDAENRVVSAKEGATTRAVYLYDGDGRRVSKTWNPGGGPPEVTHYVYDIAGRNIAEYSSEPPETDETLWLFSDILGSVRAITGEKPEMDPAPVLECYDYLPFGRMLTDQDNGRSVPGCYPGSPATYTSAADEKFTGQKRDEFLLDYFIARYYSGAQGRFASPDLPFMDQYSSDPQSWNLYAYGLNNPFRFVDRNGHECVQVDGGGWADDGQGEFCDQEGVEWEQRIEVRGTRQGNAAWISRWLFGGFPDEIYYDEDDEPTIELIGSQPLERAREAYVAAGCPAGDNNSFGFSQGSIRAFFALAGPNFVNGRIGSASTTMAVPGFVANPNLTQLGGFTGTLTRNGNTVSVRVQNTAGRSSFIGWSVGRNYIVGGLATALGVRGVVDQHAPGPNVYDSNSGLGKTVRQFFEWEESNPC